MVQNKDVVGTSDIRGVSAVLTADMHSAKARGKDVREKIYSHPILIYTCIVATQAIRVKGNFEFLATCVYS